MMQPIMQIGLTVLMGADNDGDIHQNQAFSPRCESQRKGFMSSRLAMMASTQRRGSRSPRKISNGFLATT